jgi:DNA end-binding protein Ku
MKATNSVDILIGNTEIPINIYSAIESETHFKQISVCCNASVNYRKICSNCEQILSSEEIKKALEVGDTLKEIDAGKVKVENSSLKILGLIDFDVENGVIPNGDVWFIGFKSDKSKDKARRNLMKFSYLRETLKESGVNLLGLVNVRGKEHIVVLKSYFNALIGLGVYNFSSVRDVREIGGYSEEFSCVPETLNQMVEQIKLKEKVAIKSIENTREKLIELEMTKKEMGDKLEYAKKEENPLEIISF